MPLLCVVARVSTRDVWPALALFLVLLSPVPLLLDVARVSLRDAWPASRLVRSPPPPPGRFQRALVIAVFELASILSTFSGDSNDPWETLLQDPMVSCLAPSESHPRFWGQTTWNLS